jgi:hypothetical protein
VTLPDGKPGTCGTITNGSGELECADLEPGLSYTISASWTDSQAPPATHTGTSDPFTTASGVNTAIIQLN